MPSKWKSSLLFPFEGPKRANVDYVDLDRLNDEEFLNDNIMNFYLRFVPSAHIVRTAAYMTQLLGSRNG